MKIIWNKILLEEFESLALLNETKCQVLEMKIKGYSITKISKQVGLSERSINRIIRTLKEKYNLVEPYSRILPRRD